MKKELTIEELRKKGKWPFPEWRDGKIVITKLKKVRKEKPRWDKSDEAPF